MTQLQLFSSIVVIVQFQLLIQDLAAYLLKWDKEMNLYKGDFQVFFL